MLNVKSGQICAALVGLAGCIVVAGCTTQNPKPKHENWFENKRYNQGTAPVAVEPKAAPTAPSVPSPRTVDIEVDEFTKDVKYWGPVTKTSRTDIVVLTSNQLHAVSKGAKTDYVLLVSVMHSLGGYLDFKTAVDSNAKKLGLKSGGRDLSNCSRAGCIYTENAVVQLSRQYLVEHSTSGLRIRLDGRAQQIFEVSAADVILFLSKVPAK